MKNSLLLVRFMALVLPLSFLFSAVSCDDDDNPKPVAAKMNVQFNNNVDGQALELEARSYQNMAGDTFTVSELKYYISNVKLKNSQTGKSFTEPKSYHLIDYAAGKTNFVISEIPSEEYNELEFSIGVDAAQNAKTERVGDLNTEDNMSWENRGYLFMRMGGYKISKKAPLKTGLLFHIGDNANFRTVTIPFNSSMLYEKNKIVTATISANVNKMFHSPNLIDFDVIHDTMNNSGGVSGATLVADNYANNMFTLQTVSK